MRILGMEKVDYVSKKTNNQVTGTKLHLAFESDKIEGVGTIIEFASGNKADGFGVGDEVKLWYNRYGNVDFIELA